MTVSNLKQAILREIRKQYGLTIHPDASEFLVQSFNSNGVESQKDVKEAVTTIFDILLKDNADIDIVGKDLVKKIVDSLTSVQTETARNQARSANVTSVTAHEALHVVDAFSVPKYRFEQSKFVLDENGSGSDQPMIFGTVEQKAAMFRDRFNVIKQHLMRNDKFKSSIFKENHLKISPVKNLVGCYGQQFLLFGMLTRLQNGQLCLEDLDADVRLDLSDVNIGLGIYTESCFVLCFGTYESENLFKVEEMCMPPPELRTDSLISHSLTNFYGAPASTIDEHLLNILEADENQMIIIISDLWLDQPRVLEKLGKMFQGFLDSGILPVAFILMGDFLSDTVVSNGGGGGGGKVMEKYREVFRDFANLVADYPPIAKTSHFIMVPGPSDPWCNHLLPRAALPKVFTETVKNKISNLTFTSNPCRIKYCSQDIVVFRQNLLSKMHRNAVLKTNLELEPSMQRHLVNTLLSQAYLNPFPVHISPTFWAYAHSLHIYPLPTLLVLGDRQEPFEIIENECDCVNPGVFATNDFQFQVYFPALRKCEQSQVE